MSEFDLVVIGCGPGGQKAAIAAAKLGKRAAVVESAAEVGGACVNTGTIPSKTLRETVLYLTGLSQRELYGQSYRVKSDIGMDDLSGRTAHVIDRELEVVQDQLARNRVKLIHGRARFVDPHTVAVDQPTGEIRLTAKKVVIATSTGSPGLVGNGTAINSSGETSSTISGRPRCAISSHTANRL